MVKTLIVLCVCCAIAISVAEEGFDNKEKEDPRCKEHTKHLGGGGGVRNNSSSIFFFKNNENDLLGVL